VTDEERKALASDLIRQVVDEIKDDPKVVFAEECGELILVVNALGSTLHFNPQVWAEEIIKEAEWHADRFKGKRTHEWLVAHSKQSISGLLMTVAYLFGQALWILEKLSHATGRSIELGAFYKHVQAGMKVSTRHLIDSRLRELLKLPERSHESELEDYKASGAHLQKRAYAITDSQVLDALQRLEKFSISGLARLLAPDKEDFRSSVYDWMERSGVTHDDLKERWRRFHPQV